MNTTTAEQNKNTFKHLHSESDRRRNNDRRFRSTRPLSKHSLSLSKNSMAGQRKHARRAEDHSSGGYYIDRYDSKIIVTIVSILLLCLADAYMTLLILSHGGQELNVIMELLIKESIFLFIIGKYFLTSGSLLFLVTHRKFKILGGLKVSHILATFLFGYLMLITYELAILYTGNMVSLT